MYSILFKVILFYSIPLDVFYSVLFYSILFGQNLNIAIKFANAPVTQGCK